MAVSIMDHIGSAGPDGMLHLKNAVRYILNPLKTGGGKYTGTVACASATPQDAFDDFVRTKKFFEKTCSKKTDRQGYHFVISFSPEDDVNEELAMQITEEFIHEYLSGRFEAVYAIHNDRPHLHAHIVFNSVSVADGLKYHDRKGDWERILQPIVNRLCEEHGLRTIDLEKRAQEIKDGNYPERKPYNKWQAEKEGHLTWAERIRTDIDEGILVSEDTESLFSWLRKEKEYEIHFGKYVSYRPYGKERFIRDRQLGPEYTLAAIRQRIDDIRSGKTLSESLASFEKVPTLKGVKWHPHYSSFVWRSKEDYRKYVAELYRENRLRVLRNSEAYNKEALARFYQLREEMTYVNERGFTTADDLRGQLEKVTAAINEGSGSKNTKRDLKREKKIIERAIHDFTREGGALSAKYDRSENRKLL